MNITENQEMILNFLSKYSQLFYNFSDYNNPKQWLKDDTELDEIISAVRSGEYEENNIMVQYINNCIQAVKRMEKDFEKCTISKNNF